MTREEFDSIKAGDLLVFRCSSEGAPQVGLVLSTWLGLLGNVYDHVEVVWTGRDGELGPPWWYDFSHLSAEGYGIGPRGADGGERV